MNSLRRLLAVLALAALSPASPGLSQTAPAPAEASVPPRTIEGVTVEAPRKRASPYDEALGFVRSHGAPVARSGQLGRWFDPICPVAAGLSAEDDAYVAGRVTELAREVGAPLPKVGKPCSHNVEIIFTREPQVLMDYVARKRGAFLGFHYVAQTAEFMRVRHPIQAWYLTATKGVHGTVSPDIASAPGLGVSMLGGASALLSSGQMPSGCAGSAFTHCIESRYMNALIVADGRVIEGRAIGPVADYIALLALSQVKSQDDCAAESSLLDLLATPCPGRAAPETWTSADIGFLKGLYRVNLETNLWVEKTSIAGDMARSAGGAPKPDGKSRSGPPIGAS